MSEINFSPGIYEHYKGGFYRLLLVVNCSESRDTEMVVYVSFSTGALWVRPLSTPLLEGDDCWCDLVDWPDGTKKQRFTKVGN